jgi:hypothetical protein
MAARSLADCTAGVEYPMVKSKASVRRRRAVALAPAVLLLATAAQASQPLPPRGGNVAQLAVPPEDLPVQPPPASVAPAAIIDATQADLVKRLGEGARGAKPELVVRESVVWADGSLGCAQPGQKYSMAPVPGWRLVWRAAGRDWAYHASGRGGFVYCEHPRGQGLRGEVPGSTTGDDGIRGRLPEK